MAVQINTVKPKSQGMSTSNKKPINWGNIISLVILTIAAILVIMPLLWMFSTSLRPTTESFSLPPQWLPTQFRFENYAAPFESNVPFQKFFLNSLKITLAVTFGQLITCSTAGYAFARLKFPGRNFLFILLLASLMVPSQVTIIPIFLTMRSLGLIDNHLAVILPAIGQCIWCVSDATIFQTDATRII